MQLMFHVERGSVVTVRAAMRAAPSAGNNRTLDAGRGWEGEMAYPDNKIRPLFQEKALSCPLDHPFLKMKTECFVSEKFNAH